MTTRDQVLADLDSYAQGLYDQGKIDGAIAQQPAIDQLRATIDSMTSADATEDAAYEATIADLRRQLAALQPIAYNEVSDFLAMNGNAGWAPTANLSTGKDPAQVVYRMRPHTSTKVDPSTSTNPYRLIRAGGNDASHSVDKIEISGFTLQGTDQLPTMKAYGGMNLGYSTNAHVHDMVVTGIPGYASGPPGETFSCSQWHSDYSIVEDVLCDGRVDGKGTVGVAATLFSRSSCTKQNTYRRCTAQYAAAGFGATSYISGSETWEDSVFANNRKHLNIERTYGGTYTYRRCTFKNASVPYVAQVSTDPQYGSAKVIFEDCLVDGDGIVRVRTFGPSFKNSQLDSDVRCIQRGVDVTGDPTKFLIVHTG